MVRDVHLDLFKEEKLFKSPLVLITWSRGM